LEELQRQRLRTQPLYICEPRDLTLLLRHRTIPTELFAFIGASIKKHKRRSKRSRTDEPNQPRNKNETNLRSQIEFATALDGVRKASGGSRLRVGRTWRKRAAWGAISSRAATEPTALINPVQMLLFERTVLVGSTCVGQLCFLDAQR
jgi:hypothetical protein